MWSDPIADMLTRIRNGVRIKRREVQVPTNDVVGLARRAGNAAFDLRVDYLVRHQRERHWLVIR